MMNWFESLINPFKDSPVVQPPAGVGRFYWHYMRQVWPIFLVLIVVCAISAILEVLMLRYVGDIVDIIGRSSPEQLLAEHGGTFLLMGVLVLVARPVANSIKELLVGQTLIPGFTSMIAWQAHRYLVRQGVGFFQNDYAGRLSARVVQTGSALQASVVDVLERMWFFIIYALVAAWLFVDVDWRLAVPLGLWMLAYVLMLVWFVPRIGARAVDVSRTKSTMNGRLGDTYTNIVTVKLFDHVGREDAFIRETILDNVLAVRAQMRQVTLMSMVALALDCLLIGGTTVFAIWLWTIGVSTIGDIALAIGLAVRLYSLSDWIMSVSIRVFENMGIVQESMETLSRPHTMVDRAGAMPLALTHGEVVMEDVRFNYGRGARLIEDIDLRIEPGERIGLIGRSGSGKSTLLRLLLRFHDLHDGRILIDGQDITGVTRDSLRASVGMVSQDTALLNRSLRDNLRYGRPEATDDEIMAAAQKVHADGFIEAFTDSEGRRGLDAHVGARGTTLSGGQRQRIVIARVLLKNAPLLLLDEATSALDPEVEAAIQAELKTLMVGKTVIAIAHRLSTISHMDRLVILDQGRIAECGPHRELLDQGGIYASLWRHQTNGFLGDEKQ